MKKRNLQLVMPAALVIVCLVTTAGINKWWNRQYIAEPAPQNPREVLKALLYKYVDPRAVINLSGSVVLIDEGEIKEKAQFRFIKNGVKMYHRFESLQQISNEHISIQLDTLHKLLMVTRPDKELLKQQRAGIFPFADMCDDTANFKIKMSGTERKPVLEIVNQLQPDIISYTLEYDPVAQLIQKTSIKWKKPAAEGNENRYWQTVMEYQYDREPPVDIDALIDRVVTVRRKKILIKPAYAAYQTQVSDQIKD